MNCSCLLLSIGLVYCLSLYAIRVSCRIFRHLCFVCMCYTFRFARIFFFFQFIVCMCVWMRELIHIFSSLFITNMNDDHATERMCRKSTKIETRNSITFEIFYAEFSRYFDSSFDLNSWLCAGFVVVCLFVFVALWLDSASTFSVWIQGFSITLVRDVFYDFVMCSSSLSPFIWFYFCFRYFMAFKYTMKLNLMANIKSKIKPKQKWKKKTNSTRWNFAFF